MSLHKEVIDNNMNAANSPVIITLEGIYQFSHLAVDELITKVQSLLFNKCTRGLAGGSIGVTQVNNEYKRITTFHTSL